MERRNLKKKARPKKGKTEEGKKEVKKAPVSPAMRELREKAERIRKLGSSYMTKEMMTGNNIIMFPTMSEVVEKTVKTKLGKKVPMSEIRTPDGVWFKENEDGMYIHKVFKCTKDFDSDGKQGTNYITLSLIHI